MLKRTAKGFSIAVAITVFLAGCGASNEGPIKMISEATFPPYEFLRDMEIVGVDVEIGRAIAAKLGREFKVDTIDFDSVLPAVLSGRADVAISGITVTEERKAYVDFSIPYVTAGIVVVSRKDLPFVSVDQMKGKRIGVQVGTTSEDYVHTKLKQDPKCYASAERAIDVLRAGGCDFAIADVGVARHCAWNDPKLAVSDFLTSEDYAVAIAKGQPELLKVINDTIAELKANGAITKWIESFAAESNRTKDE